ncbi:PadR family transcriptional regulator [Agromyces aurantiacus]|uniref:PadR family transcriptional regulator n=1 Tax=Agromyces aurantiacus TaxID=165814 RepID=A0ABV9RAN8_9MICO|nr:PadR family transcriptional regulator [Agromyces aurantiacus]MBM7504085.1 DNA-binding PadR family transcriptional regulator [Agromyces aurantiacus]
MPRRREGRLVGLEVDILGAGIELQAEGGDFYGFALAKRIADHAGASALTAHGTLYKALNRLAERGLVESEWEDPAAAAEEGRPRRRLYRVTGAGAIAYRAEVAQRAVFAPAPKSAFA